MTFENSLDPELLPYFQGLSPLYEKTLVLEEVVDRMREDVDTQFTQSDKVKIDTITIPDLTGDSSLVLRTYQPENRDQHNKLPVILWMHGGGFVSGSVQGGDYICEKIVLYCHCVVVSVDYRLAPQYPYPAALDDCYAALLWLASEKANKLVINAGKMAIGGVSAGACLAAGVVLRARDENGPGLIYQLLLVPALDDRHKTPSSYSVTDTRVWCRPLSLVIWKNYLRNTKGEIPSYAAPARSTDFSTMPPTFISVEEQDLLRDEGIGYAQRLMQSDVNTELHVYAGTFHGSFVAVPEAEVSKRHIRDFLDALKAVLSCS